MSDHQIPLIWQKAIQSYEEITNKKLDDPDLLKLQTVRDLLQEIERRNGQFLQFRNRKHALFECLTIAMKPVELLGNVTSHNASINIPTASLVFGAVAHLLSAAKSVSASYDAIQELMDTLKNFTMRLEIFRREEISSELSDKLSQSLTALIEIFAFSRNAIKCGRFLKYGRNVLSSSDDGIKRAVEKLAILSLNEDRVVGAESLTEIKRSGRVVDEISNAATLTNIAVTEMCQKFDALRHDTVEENEAKNSAKLHSTLKPSTSSQDWYDRINRQRLIGTGDWVREEAIFKSWTRREKPVLWISGIPGAGKSYLSSNIISFLTEQNHQGPSHLPCTSVAYFFFRDDSSHTKSFNQALRDMAFQISQNDQIYAKYLETYCHTLEDIETIESAWRKLFRDFFLAYSNWDSRVYLVLDGLDEANRADMERFLLLARDLAEAPANGRLQLALIGRPELIDDIFAALEVEIPTIHVDSTKNWNDIVRYIKQGIHKSNYLNKVSTELQLEIVERLSKGAEGMFLWANLMLKELLKQRREGEIRKRLHEAPKGLTEIIRHVMRRFSVSFQNRDDLAEDLNEMLMWITCVIRPLKLFELEAILKNRSGDAPIGLEEQLRKQYASFFELTREDGLSTADFRHFSKIKVTGLEDDSEDDRSDDEYQDIDYDTYVGSNFATTEVKFCHSSIGDFCRFNGMVSAGPEYPSIGVNYAAAKLYVLKSCLSLLCTKPTPPKQASSSAMETYAANSWLIHLKDVAISETNEQDKIFIAKCLLKMFNEDESMIRWAGWVTLSFIKEDNLKTIILWLEDKDVIRELLQVDRNMITSVLDSPIEIFHALANKVAREWLVEERWSPEQCCLFVYSYHSLRLNRPFTARPEKPEQVIELAELCLLEKTSRWHRRLGVTLRDLNMHLDALNHFEKALELETDTRNRLTIRVHIGEVYYQQKNYNMALAIDKVSETEFLELLSDKNSADNEPTIVFSLHDNQERMAECYRDLQDTSNAISYFKKAFTNHGRCAVCIDNLIEMLFKDERYIELANIITSMIDLIPGSSYTRFTEYLMVGRTSHQRHLHMIILSFVEANERDWLLKVVQNAIISGRKKLPMMKVMTLELFLADICYGTSNDEYRGVGIWKGITRMSSSPKLRNEFGDVINAASFRLARHYLIKATEEVHDSYSSEKYGRKLDKLAKGSYKLTATSVRTNQAYLLFGVWLYFNGRTQEAYSCFRMHTEEALQGPCHSYQVSTYASSINLTSILLLTGDDKNAIAFAQKTWGNDPHKKGSWFICDGCEVESSIYNASLCRYCTGITGFCVSCMKLLKTNSLRVKVCSPKHDWVFIPPLEKKIPGKLFVDGEYLELEDWKRRLREKWSSI